MTARPSGQNGQSYRTDCPVHLPDKLSRESSLTTFEKPIAKRSRLESASRESPRTTTVGASGEVAAADPQKDSRQDLIRSLADLPSPNAPPLDQAEKTITAQVADFGEPIVKQALGRLRTRLLGGEKIPKPTRILQLICEDIRRERCERSPNRYAAHGWSRFG